MIATVACQNPREARARFYEPFGAFLIRKGKTTFYRGVQNPFGEILLWQTVVPTFTKLSAVTLKTHFPATELFKCNWF